jgi:hypothetical protein
MYQINTKSKIYRISFGTAMLAGCLVLIYIIGCFSARNARQEDAVALALDWNKMILKAERTTEGYRGPVASRAYGYFGLAAYETSLPGLAGDFESFTNKFSGLHIPHAPQQQQYDMIVAMNECYATLMGLFFRTAEEVTRKEFATLATRWNDLSAERLDTLVINTSKAYGHNVAIAIFEWSATDSLGFGANHHNYDRNFVPPVGDGKWVTSADFPMPALLPYWGNVRSFIVQKEKYHAKAPPAFSTEKNQHYYIQALELISLSKPLSAENQWIAEFWSDDHQGLTFTPPGHWLAITNQVIEKEHPSIEKTMETYLKVGFALADAMIVCWASKYVYNLERPETYIQKNIDPGWRPFSPSPSFPSYPSGHSMMGAAVAEILTDMYGANYQITDISHYGLEDFKIKPRSFNSFDEMARENALSRLLLGVHWRLDAEEGLRLGSLLGQEVSQVVIENKLTE